MIILDTNVLSELVRQRPEPRVIEWVDAHDRNDVFLTAVTVMELRYGIEVMPDGRRRSAIETEVRHLLDLRFAGRILPFDQQAAETCAHLRSARRAAGRPLDDLADAAIAAITLSHAATLATRNLADFADLGLDLADPWAMPQSG